MICSRDFDNALDNPHIQEIAATAYRRLHQHHLQQDATSYHQAIAGVLQEGRLSDAEYYATWHLMSERARQEQHTFRNGDELALFGTQEETNHANS